MFLGQFLFPTIDFIIAFLSSTVPSRIKITCQLLSMHLRQSASWMISFVYLKLRSIVFNGSKPLKKAIPFVVLLHHVEFTGDLLFCRCRQDSGPATMPKA